MTPSQLTELARKMVGRDAYFLEFKDNLESEDGEPQLLVIFELRPVEAPAVLGYVPDEEEWLEEDD
jgi:hypothetical protein